MRDRDQGDQLRRGRVDVDLPLNGWGDHIPDGKMFALADASPNAADIEADPGRTTPLLILAAVGDCIKVHFTNEITGKRVGMHVDGVATAVTGPGADGARIGNNDDSTAAPGAERTWHDHAGVRDRTTEEAAGCRVIVGGLFTATRREHRPPGLVRPAEGERRSAVAGVHPIEG